MKIENKLAIFFTVLAVWIYQWWMHTSCSDAMCFQLLFTPLIFLPLGIIFAFVLTRKSAWYFNVITTIALFLSGVIRKVWWASKALANPNRYLFDPENYIQHGIWTPLFDSEFYWILAIAFIFIGLGILIGLRLKKLFRKEELLDV